MRSGKAAPKSPWKAFDEAAYGSVNTLNLRESLPTVADARFRVEAWLRERQVGRASEVLVITGRGNNSPGGVSAVREGVVALLPMLRRRGVVSEWREHSPGSFVITLATLGELLAAPRRKHDEATGAAIANPQSLAALEPSTVALLRNLALRSLEILGVREPGQFVDAEMVSQFDKLARGVRPGPDGEKRLRAAIASALDELDD